MVKKFKMVFGEKIMKTKKCTKCGIEKPLSEFYMDKKWYRNDCKKCHNSYVTKLINNDKKKKPCKYILKSIQQRCNNPNRNDYKYYGGRGIKCLITEEEIKSLWFRDKAYLMKKPSIDRKDNDGHYEYSNCRFIELADNINRMNFQRQKTILQFDKKGNFIREWNSIIEAEKSLKIFIHFERKTSGGCIWKYKKN